MYLYHKEYINFVSFNKLNNLLKRKKKKKGPFLITEGLTNDFYILSKYQQLTLLTL